MHIHGRTARGPAERLCAVSNHIVDWCTSNAKLLIPSAQPLAYDPGNIPLLSGIDSLGYYTYATAYAYDLQTKQKACTTDRIIAIHGTGSKAQARARYLQRFPDRIVYT
jgi:hypothetical protein